MNIFKQCGGFGGSTFRPDPNMIESYEDWSEVRSPSRARRRLKRGFKQRIKIRWRPRKDAITIDGGKTYFMHPTVYVALRDADLSKI